MASGMRGKGESRGGMPAAVHCLACLPITTPPFSLLSSSSSLPFFSLSHRLTITEQRLTHDRISTPVEFFTMMIATLQMSTTLLWMVPWT